MERNRDLRKTTISAVNGLPRRRPNITTLRDSTDMDRQMELQETLRLRDREQVEKKARDREFAKRRRVDRYGSLQRSGGGGGGGESYRENDSTDSSDEEYCAEEEDTRIHQRNRMSQLSPTSSSLSNNRWGLRTLRSSPVVRAAADEMLGVLVPRRARSGSAKRLQEYCNSASGGFGDDLHRRKFSSSPAIVGLVGSGSGSQSFSGASMKKMKSVEPRNRVPSNASNSKLSSAIQDDIEIEVVEALFDLMKQSQSQSQSPPKQDKVDRESADTSDDDLQRLKAAGGKDENNAFLVQNEQSVKVGAETTLADSMKELKKERRSEKEKFPDDPAQELVGGDGFVNKGKVGSPKETESPSCVKVNACDIQDPTVTKADQAAIVVEAKKEAKLEIDLMAPPPLPSFSERGFLVDIATDPKDTTRYVQKKSDTISEVGPLAVANRISEENVRVSSSNRLPNLDLEKRWHDISRVSDSTTQHQQSRSEQKNQYTTSVLPFPIGMSSWPSVLPRPGYMPPLQAVLPIDGSARSSLTTQPQFNFSQPRLKRCSTHQNIAHNIHHHQQLIKKSLSSGPIGPATLYGTKPLNLKSKLPRQKFIPGNTVVGDIQGGHNFATISDGSRKDKVSDAAAAFNATANNNFSHGSGLIFPIGHRQTTMTSSANSSGPASSVGSESLPSISAGRLSVNLPLHGASGAVSFNQPTFSSIEAAPYMTMLQNNSVSNLPSFRGVSTNVPFFNSSLYSSPVYNITQNQQQPLSLPHASVQSASHNMSIFGGSSSHKQSQGHHQHNTSTKISDDKLHASVNAYSSSKSDREISRRSGSSPVADGLVSHSMECNNNGQTYAFPVQAMNFAVIPPGKNKHGDPPHQGGANLIPQAFALSFGSNASTTSALNLSSMMQNSAMMYHIAAQQQKNFQASEPFNFSKSDVSALSVPKLQQHQHQQQQMIQAQKHHMHQMQQIAGGAATQGKASTTNPVFAMNPVFTSLQSGKWENFSQNTNREGSSQSANSTLLNVPQLKISQGSHITFGNNNPVSSPAFQGSPTNSSVSKNNGSSHRTMSTVSKSSQDTEVCPNGGSQKLSPACRRNVTSILSTCPSQLSELKY